MNAVANIDGANPGTEGDKPKRARAPKNPGAKVTRKAGESLPKSLDPEWEKANIFFPRELLKKIRTAAIDLGVDQSDLVAKACWPVFSAVAIHGKPKFDRAENVSAA
jgi:hypothetical protein